MATDDGARDQGASAALPEVLRDLVDAIHPLTPATWAALLPLFTRRTLAPREYFSPAGEVQLTVGLLERGHLKASVLTAGGTPYTKHLFVAPAIVGDYASLLTGAPVEIPQQAITACTVWVAEHRAMLALEARHPDLVMLQRRFAEGLYLLTERRELELATLDAASRYAELVARYPALETEVPLYEVAASLGITPTQLSRLRSRPRRRGIST